MNKKMAVFLRTLLTGIYLSTPVVICCLSPLSETRSIFDDPYPNTPFRSVLTACAHLWQLYDNVTLDTTSLTPQTLDTINRRCRYLEKQVSLLINQELPEQSVPPEDIAYLVHLCDQLITMHATTTLNTPVYHQGLLRLLTIHTALSTMHTRY